jgi:ABC-type glycerol-3-phosphate transport system substrate-binding protein
MFEGNLYGLPNDVAPIVFWYNKELLGKPVFDLTKIKYWEDFLDAIKKCKVVGVTPIIVGGVDERPLHFYPVLLMMRILGKDRMAAAYKGDNGGFAGPDMVKGWSMYRELCDLDPFQFP